MKHKMFRSFISAITWSINIMADDDFVDSRQLYSF